MVFLNTLIQSFVLCMQDALRDLGCCLHRPHCLVEVNSRGYVSLKLDIFLHNFHMCLGGCPNPRKIERGWECTFLNLYTHVKTKRASKKFSTFDLHRQQLACAANPALIVRIDRVHQAAISEENFFESHFVFTWEQRFKKVRSQHCSILLGLGQPPSHMCFCS